MSTTTRPLERSPRPKATLFCFQCGHESHFEGDWIVHEYDDSADYECPVCGTTITSRRRVTDSTTDSEQGLSCPRG